MYLENASVFFCQIKKLQLLDNYENLLSDRVSDGSGALFLIPSF